MQGIGSVEKRYSSVSSKSKQINLSESIVLIKHALPSEGTLGFISLMEQIKLCGNKSCEFVILLVDKKKNTPYLTATIQHHIAKLCQKNLCHNSISFCGIRHHYTTLEIEHQLLLLLSVFLNFILKRCATNRP